MECELCAAVDEEYRLIMQNENAFAIVAIDAQVDYHSLVLPKRHLTRLSELTPQESQDLNRILEDLTIKMDGVLGCSSITVMNGIRYRTQAHLHYQVYPVYDGVKTIIGGYLGIPERRQLSPIQLERMAKQLR
jgi:diadenosine tetraphosphate (Ap4A) HIT family hydrolase